MAALRGVRILDLTRMLPGPLCSWFLRGMGASIDRVEPSGTGDFTRHVPPFHEGVGVFYAALNRGQRSIAVDLRNPTGPLLLKQIMGSYDVLLEGFKPGVMETIGLAPEDLLRQHPRLIVARLSGFGQTGPWRTRPGHDVNYIGLAGVLAYSGLSKGQRALPPAQIADTSGGLIAAMGISAALYEREKTNSGRILDVSLTESALAMMGPHIATHTAMGKEPVGGGEMLTGALPIYGTYECADGRWLTLGALEPKFQALVAQNVGQISSDALKAEFKNKTRDEWVEILEGACAGPALEVGEVADHPQHVNRGVLRRIAGTTFVRPPFASGDWFDGGVPALGANAEEILRDAGLTTEQIADARASGALGRP